MTFTAIDNSSFELLREYFLIESRSNSSTTLRYRHRELGLPERLSTDQMVKLARYSNFLEVIDDNYSKGNLSNHVPNLFYFVSSIKRDRITI